MSASRDVDVAVIGGGVMGCAAARACARRGWSTALFEQHILGNERGSSHGPSRIIRLAYRDPFYIPLAREAFTQWQSLEEEEATAPLITRTGGLDLAHELTVPDLQIRRESMDRAGVSYEELDADGLRSAYPQLRADPGAAALYQDDTAVLAADACVRALADSAARAGAVIRTGERVEAVKADGEGASITTSAGVVRASRVILASGGWIKAQLAALGLPLPLLVTREQVVFLGSRDIDAFRTPQFPVIIHHRQAGKLVSIFPAVGADGVKLMFDCDGEELDPDVGTRDVRPDRAAELGKYATCLMPGMEPQPLKITSCLYTYTPDGDFIVDRCPGNEQIVIVSACSGHGFKFGPVIGRLAAELVEPDPAPLERFVADRPALAAMSPPAPDRRPK